MTTTSSTCHGELDSPAEVLVFARERTAAADRAQADLLMAAVAWAEQHPPESIGEQATWITAAGDTGLPIAGVGGTAGLGVLHRGVRPRDRALHRRRPQPDRRIGGAEVPADPDLGPGAVR
jgi:hypothetical protein